MKYRCFCAFVTFAAFVLSIFAHPVSTGAVDIGAFTDIEEAYPYSEAVNYLKDMGIVEGYGDGTYKPENTINRAEFVKIILLSKGETPAGTACFPDVGGQWYDGYVCRAFELGLVEGYPDGTFKPERPINFVESGKIISIGLSLETDGSFRDDWYHPYVKALEFRGAIPLTVTTFDEYIDRGEMAEMIWRIKTNQNLSTASYADLALRTRNQLVHEISSCAELKEKFESSELAYYGHEGMVMEQEFALPGDSALTESTRDVLTAGSTESLSVDYSTTNIQVEGVDEADIVKTDGEYIYIVKGDSVRVVKAHPPSDMIELDAVTFNDERFRPRDMYVDGNRLVVIGSSYVTYNYPVLGSAETAIFPYYGGGISKVYIMDISDKRNIRELRKLEFEGDYNRSRKVDEMVYVVLNRYTFWAYPQIGSVDEIIPRYKDGRYEQAVPICDCTDIKYVPDFDQSNYLILAGIPIDDINADIVKEVVLGSSGEIYASRNHIYATSVGWSHDWRTPANTNVYKFNLRRDNVDFLAKGKVPGRILNQFSMDEYDGHFRIATTKGSFWSGSLANNVYVLDKDMNMVGKLEDIAPGETIYSTRFIGDRLYMVTFEQIDPFFVIDMADHKFPKILGELKIPGYSDYLHPYDENHIIGFGKETIDPAELDERDLDWFGFEWFQGMKIALFDVTDVKNPIQKFKVVIGDRGTDSPLLYDHRALLFSKDRNLLAFPVRVAKLSDNVKNPDEPRNIYGEYVFQGAYVYHIDTENGFNLRAQITHHDEIETVPDMGYYWFNEKDIERVLYINNYLYTVSKGMVKANDMNMDYKETNSVEVGGESYAYIMME